MARVFLYEDSGGSLYLHRQGGEAAYANVELMVPYGATFEQDASEIDEGRTVTGDGAMKIPFTEFETMLVEAPLKRIATWEDGVVHRYAHPGRDGALYLGPPAESNLQADVLDHAGL